MSNRIKPTLVRRQYPSFHFIGIRTAYGSSDGALIPLDDAIDNGKVFFFCYACFHLVNDLILDKAVLCDYQQPGCVHIKSVCKSYLITCAFIQDLFHQAIGNGMAGFSFGWVYYKSRLFVYDKKTVIFKYDIDGYVLRRKIRGFRRKCYGQLIAGDGDHPATDRGAVQPGQILLFYFCQQP